MLGALKRALLKPLLLPGVTEILATMTAARASIFMLHRFAIPELGVTGEDAAMLRRTLAHLRRRRWELLSLEDLFARLLDEAPLNRAIAFTMDDGYFEQAQVAAPIFAEFDCPVTTFLTTDFIDGEIWFWWDRVTFAFENTKKADVRAQLGDREMTYLLDSAEARRAAAMDLILRCQEASEAERTECLAGLPRAADVEIPVAAPARFAPLTWDEARALENQGMTFGPHTVTHPVLSSVSDEQAEIEINESWQRLNAELRSPVPIFCYPTGRPADSGEREIAILRRLGLRGAVLSQPGEIRPAEFRHSVTARYRVPRFGYQNSMLHVLQSVAGIELAKLRLRGRGRAAEINEPL